MLIWKISAYSSIAQHFIPQAYFPLPGSAHHILYAGLGLPSQFFLGPGVVGINGDHISGAAGAQFIIELYTGNFFKGPDGFQYGYAITGAQVKYFAVAA